MANTFKAPFAQTPQTASAVSTTAVGSLSTTAPTNTTLLVTAGANGALLTGLTAIPRATVTASSLVLFTSTDGGATKHLFASVLMPVQTVSTTAEIAKTSFSFTEAEPRRLKADEQIYIGSQVAQASGIVFNATWTDF